MAGRWGAAGSWVLVACALVTTVLVIRREFFAKDALTAAIRDPVEIKGWRDALDAGIHVGPASAPVQVVQFADFECPMCSRFDVTLQELRRKYPDKVALTLVPFPLPYHEYAEPAVRAAECANAQGRADAMVPLLFARQKQFGTVAWTDLAREAAVPDMARFETCVNETTPMARVDKARKLAETIGVRGTPTVIVNGWKLPITPTMRELEKMVGNVVDGRKPVSGIDFRVNVASL